MINMKFSRRTIFVLMLTSFALTASSDLEEPFMTPPWEMDSPKHKNPKRENSDPFQDFLDVYHTQLAKDVNTQQMLDEQQITKQAKHLTELMAVSKNVCTNGEKPSSLSTTSYLQEFGKGPCAPTVFIPGIAASLLHVQIDCNKLKSSDPFTFGQCGWTSCSGSKAPLAEYKVWIPRLTYPMSIIKPSDRSRNCWKGLIGLNISGSGSSTKLSGRNGVTVAPIGDTRQTSVKSKGQCGFTAIEELLPLLVNISGFHYFKNFKNTFLSAGYKIGVTMQALPYDYRIDYRKNKLN
jgi:hypothetical protein